jgi:hypothetical protein
MLKLTFYYGVGRFLDLRDRTILQGTLPVALVDECFHYEILASVCVAVFRLSGICSSQKAGLFVAILSHLLISHLSYGAERGTKARGSGDQEALFLS